MGSLDRTGEQDYRPPPGLRARGAAETAYAINALIMVDAVRPLLRLDAFGGNGSVWRDWTAYQQRRSSW